MAQGSDNKPTPLAPPQKPNLHDLARENLIVWMNNPLIDIALQAIALNLITAVHSYPALSTASFKTLPEMRNQINPEKAQIKCGDSYMIRLSALTNPEQLGAYLENMSAHLAKLYNAQPVLLGSVRLALLLPPPGCVEPENDECIQAVLLYTIEKV